MTRIAAAVNRYCPIGWGVVNPYSTTYKDSPSPQIRFAPRRRATSGVPSTRDHSFFTPRNVVTSAVAITILRIRHELSSTYRFVPSPQIALGKLNLTLEPAAST